MFTSPQKEPHVQTTTVQTDSMDQNRSSGRNDPVDGGMRFTEQTSEPGSLVHPTADDIILGRGVLHATHPGNMRFYAIIDQHIPTYNAAQTRSDKTQVVQNIYDILTSVARFVKEDPPSAACVVIDEKESKKKISHAIRYRRRPEKTTSRRTRSQSPSSPTSSPRQRPRRRPPPHQQQQPRQPQREPQSQSQSQSSHGLRMRQDVVDRSTIQPIQLPPLQHPIQFPTIQQPMELHPIQQQKQFLPLQQPIQLPVTYQLIPFPPVQQPIHSHRTQQATRQLQEDGLHLPAPGDAPQQGNGAGGSPSSLFGDAELESVLLPPEVMASARMPYEEFLGEEFEDETDRGTPKDRER